MSKREERALTKQRAAYSNSQIADNYALWDKFVNYYSDQGQEMTEEVFNGISLDERLRILDNRFGGKQL